MADSSSAISSLPRYLAEKLFSSFVEEWAVGAFEVGNITTDSSKQSTYFEKARQYREAAVLLCLANSEIEDRRFTPVRESFEVIIHPVHLRQAIDDLRNLASVGSGEFSWARAWMLAIGIDISNPATLAMISLDWKALLRTISAVLGDWRSSDWFDEIISHRGGAVLDES